MLTRAPYSTHENSRASLESDSMAGSCRRFLSANSQANFREYLLAKASLAEPSKPILGPHPARLPAPDRARDHRHFLDRMRGRMDLELVFPFAETEKSHRAARTDSSHQARKRSQVPAAQHSLQRPCRAARRFEETFGARREDRAANRRRLALGIRRHARFCSGRRLASRSETPDYFRQENFSKPRLDGAAGLRNADAAVRGRD